MGVGVPGTSGVVPPVGQVVGVVVFCGVVQVLSPAVVFVRACMV